MTVKRGEIYYADLSPVVGSEQGGMRPVLIVQNDVGNRYSPTVIAAAITSQLEKSKLTASSAASPRTPSSCWSRSAPLTSAACGSAWAASTTTPWARSTAL